MFAGTLDALDAPLAPSAGVLHPPVAPQTPPDDGSRRARSSPLVRRLAEEHGVDLSRIQGTGQMQRIVFNENWEELRREAFFTDLRQRIRDVKQGPDGLLYVLTDEEDGAILRLEPAK